MFLLRSAPLAALLLLLAACGPATPPPASAPAGPSAAELERIARVENRILPPVRVRGREYAPATIEERMAALGVPGVSIAVIRGGKIAWARAYGVTEAGGSTPVTPETLFQAASMSKPVAAMAALSLVEEGRLSLDEDVNAWLGAWRVPGHQWQAESPVTLRQLLSHTAGLTVHGFPGYAAGIAIPTTVQVLAGGPPANTAAVTVAARPGSRWQYSGGGYTVMQLLLEEVTGTPFERLLRERVFLPTGMTRSTYAQPLPAARAGEAATGHRPGAQPIPGGWHVYPEMAAAGLWTTPSDLARWVTSVQRSLAGATDGVLSPEMARRMITVVDRVHGLGPQVDGEGATLHFYHGGANEGFRGLFVGFAETGDGAVIMSSADAGSALNGEIMLAIGEAYGWNAAATFVEIVPVPLTPAELAEYAGPYGPEQRPIVFHARDGSLWVDPGSGESELIPVGGNRFRDSVYGQTMEFERGPDGVIVAVRVGGNRFPRR
jgi:CubicO group peptidase (beta-lactamase class C family)